MLKIKWKGDFYTVAESDLSLFPGYEMVSGEEIGNLGNSNDSTGEIANAGSENLAINMDSTLEGTSSELPTNPNREKLIQLEAELDATRLDPKTMNSDENFRKRKRLRRQIKELGGLEKIQEEKLEEVIVGPKYGNADLARRTHYRTKARDLFEGGSASDLAHSLGLDVKSDITYKELSDHEEFEKLAGRRIKDTYFNTSASGEKLPHTTPAQGTVRRGSSGNYTSHNYSVSVEDQTAMDGIFKEELLKTLEKESDIETGKNIEKINYLKKNKLYQPLVTRARSNENFDYSLKPDHDKVRNIGGELDNLRKIYLDDSKDEGERAAAVLKMKELMPEYMASWNKINNVRIGTTPDGEGIFRKSGDAPYMNKLTGDFIGTYEKEEISGEAVQHQNKYTAVLNSYKNLHYQDLETAGVLRQMDLDEYNLNINKTIDITIPGLPGSWREEALKELGYISENIKYDNFGDKIDVVTGRNAGVTIKNVKYSDLLNLRNQKSSASITGARFMKNLEGIGENNKPFDLEEKVTELHDEKIDLQLRKAALEEMWILNNDPAQFDKINPLDFLASATKNMLGSVAGFFNKEGEKTFKQSLSPTKRERLDNLKGFISDNKIPLSKEQKDNLKRSWAFELFGETLPAFTGDLIKFGIANKVAGAAGITARIAKLTKTNPFQAFMATNFLEGAKFSAVMQDTDMFSSGVFFGAGSQIAAKILPKLLSVEKKLGLAAGTLSKYQRVYEKIVGGGTGMATGSEVDAFSHALLDAAMGDKGFMTSMDDLYGEQSDWGRRITLNLGMGSALGGIKVNRKVDLANMATRRTYALEIQEKLLKGEYKGGEEKQKELLLEHLNRDIAIVDQQFNDLNLGDQRFRRDVAQVTIESGKVVENGKEREATKDELKEARKIVNTYEINKSNAIKSIKEFEKNVKESDIFPENFKVEIKDGDGSMLGEGNKAEFAGNFVVKIDINKYRPGVFAQEIGHAMMKAAFSNNRKAATIFRDKIIESANKSLKGRTFTVGKGENKKTGLTFEEAIKEAYRKSPSKQPEEYVMNVVEFLSAPEYRHLLLEKGLINDIKRSTLLIAVNKAGLDYSNKKNFKTGEELLEFLFSIGKIAEGGSAESIKKKFEAFKNIVIDGKELYNKTTGEKVTSEKIAASKDFSKEIVGVEKIRLKIKENRSGISGLKIGDPLKEYEAVWEREKVLEDQIKRVKELEADWSATGLRAEIEKYKHDRFSKHRENLELALEEKFAPSWLADVVKTAGMDIKTGETRFSKEITGERKSVLEEIKGLIPKEIKTKAQYEEWSENPKTGGRILGDAFSPAGNQNLTFPKTGGPIFNYIKAGKTKAESDKTLMDVLERTMKFDPEATRKDGSKVGVEGFGERIFADAAWAKLTSRTKLFEDSERIKKEKQIDDGTLQIAGDIVNNSFDQKIFKKGKVEKTERAPSIIQRNLKINGEKILDEKTDLRNDFIKEADNVLQVLADKGIKSSDKGFRKALEKELLKNNPELLEKFKNKIGEEAWDSVIKSNLDGAFANPRALPLSFYVQAEKFFKNTGRKPLFVQKSSKSKYIKNKKGEYSPESRATQKNLIEEAIKDGKASYTENTANGVLVFDRLRPSKNFRNDAIDFFKVQNTKQKLLETLYKQSLIDAIINNVRTNKKIYTTKELSDIATKFQKDQDTYFSAEIEAETKKGGRGIREKLFGPLGLFKDRWEEEAEYIDLIERVNDIPTLKSLSTFFQTTNTVTYGNRHATQGKETLYKTKKNKKGEPEFVLDKNKKKIPVKDENGNNKKVYNGKLKYNASQGSFMISGSKEFTGPEAARNKKLYEAGELFDVEILQNKIADKLEAAGETKWVESEAIKWGKKSTQAGAKKAFKTIAKETENNVKQEELTKEAIQEYIDATGKLYQINKRATAALLYNQNASSGINRMLAKAIGFEKGTKPGQTSRYEHILQNGEFNLLIQEIAETTNPKSKKIMTDWVKENYRQLVITKATEKIVDDTYVSVAGKEIGKEGGTLWKGKQELHPDVRAAWDKVKNGDTSVKIPSAEIRFFNDFILGDFLAGKKAKELRGGKRRKKGDKTYIEKLPDPNELFTFNAHGEKITYAKKYGVDVLKKFLNDQVRLEQYKLITEIIRGSRTKASATKEIGIFAKSIVPANIKAQKFNSKAIKNDNPGVSVDRALNKLNREQLLKHHQDQARHFNTKDVHGIIKDLKSKEKENTEKEIDVMNSKDISGEFNSYLEKATGIGKEKTFSDAKGVARGKRAKKDFGDYFIPVGAEDFAGLMHKTLARGKEGEQQLEFYKKNLYEPFNEAVENLTRETTALANDYRALQKLLPTIPKTLKKFTKEGDFTMEQAARVAVWDKLGYEIPGLSKSDKASLLKEVKSNSELSVFVNELTKITKGEMYAKPDSNWVAGNIAMDFVSLINKAKRTNHLQVWQNNANTMFSKENLNKLEAAYGPKYRQTLERTLERMKTGQNRKWGGNATVERWNNWVNNSVGVIMFLNTKSAVLQTISSINYVNWADNNPIQAAKAFANQKQYWKDFKDIFNSDYLKDRRGGLKINVNEAELVIAAEKGGPRGVIALLLNKGFILTRIADSFAIASGGATMLRNRLNRYKKEGMSEKEAKEKAFLDFKAITEETQQSSRADRISEQQASNLGRLLLAFANTPMQYNRIIKRNAQDLFEGRGNRADKLTKIIYYSTVQNFIFNALQKALFSLAFNSDNDEEQKIKKYAAIGEGMADSLLRGSGLTGNAMVAVKNVAIDIANRIGKPNPRFQDAAWEALTVSPPLSSKAKKLRGAGYALGDVTRENLFKPSLDNPALSAVTQTLSATINLPLDRAQRKSQNIEGAMSDEAEYWQKVALTLGYPGWEIDMKKEKSKKERKKRKKKYKKYAPGTFK